MEVMYMFIGRERELDALNKLYKSNKFEFAVISTFNVSLVKGE